MRSRTAEAVFSANALHNVKSAGINNTAKVKLTSELISWADIIFVMEEKYAILMRSKFPEETKNRVSYFKHSKPIDFMQPELVKLNKNKSCSIFESIVNSLN
jgi:predicted protein tyrosine phosphatase